MLLSIVMPVYNSEKFLIECLDSIIHQLLPNTELIIVNDCSTDNSKNILDYYLNNISSEKINLIKLINLKENKGVGFARTIAIQSSSGRYICSIDPDDIISNDYILKIINLLEVHNPDILQFHISRFFNDINKKNIISNHFLNEGLYNIDNGIKKCFYEQNFWSFCSRVIKKDLFEGVDFHKLRNCEDVYALPLIYSKAKNIYILNKDLYYYRLNANSLSKSDLNIENCIKAYNFIIDNYLINMKSDGDLYFSLVPIIRGYIQFCLDKKGYNFARLALIDCKRKVKISITNEKKFNKLTHNLFVLFGVNFLMAFRLIGK